MKKLTIGFFIDSYFPLIDGVTNVVHNYATRLAKHANVIVFCPQIDKKYDDSIYNYKIVRCKAFKVGFLDYKLSTPKIDGKFKKILKNSNLDIVHIHSFFAIGKIGLNYAKKHNIKAISTIHSQYQIDIDKNIRVKFIAKKILKMILKQINRSDEIFAVNSKLADLYNEMGVKKKINVLANATDLIYFKDDSEILKLKTKYDIKAEKVLLFVGRIDKIKNLEFVVNVLKKLKEKQFQFKMIFIGDGRHKKDIEKMCLNYQLNNVIFLGKIQNRQEIAKYFRVADLFIFPSIYDSSSLVQIEAASQKLPAIFLKDTITASNITNNFTGYIEEFNEEKFADRIINILKDEKKHHEIRENVYEKIYKKWDDLTDDIYQYYLKKIKE